MVKPVKQQYLLQSTTILASRALAGLAILASSVIVSGQAEAAPCTATPVFTGGTVGTTVTCSGANTNVTQTTDRAILDWSNFNTGSGEKVNFNQPTAGAIALNRINSGSLTTFSGLLQANGNIILVNDHGIMFNGTSK